MGTWGTGPFDSDGAMDLVGELARQDAGRRREALEQTFRLAMEHPEKLGRKVFPDEVVAGAAVVAASLPGGEGLLQELADDDYAAAAIIPNDDHSLIDLAREALNLAAGRDGPWHDGWVRPEDAAEARRTADRLAAIFLREQHSHEQELPFEEPEG